MKRLCLALLLAILAIPCARGGDGMVTNLTSYAGGLQELFGGQWPSNITVGPFVSMSTKADRIGYGVAAVYNVTGHVGLGVVMDSIPARFTLFTGQVVLKSNLYPLAWTGWEWVSPWYITPFGFAGVGAGWSGGSSGNSGGAVVVSALGVILPVATIAGKPVALASWWENLTGAGDYSGNRLGMTGTISF